MNEVKIRAYDYQNDEMIYGVGITPESDTSIPYKVNDEDESFQNFSYYPESVWLPSAGVKDKEGLEIYEGDVLYHPMQGKREVYYPFMEHVASFGLRNVENGMAGTLSDSHIYKIIGNIFENPELLRGE